MSKRIQYAAWSCKGHVRSKNQDNLYCGDGFSLEEENSGMQEMRTGEVSPGAEGLFAVFDGMGGEAAGEKAAYMAVRQLRKTDACFPAWKKTLFPRRFFESFCYAANADIDQYRRAHNYTAMGTTVAAILVQGRKIIVCNAGDSRIYRFSGNTYTQVSKDHTALYRFIGSAPLTQFLGMPADEIQIQPAMCTFPYKSGERYLLCTDGVWNCTGEQMLKEKMHSERTLREQMMKIFDMVSECGERDNATAILMELA